MTKDYHKDNSQKLIDELSTRGSTNVTHQRKMQSEVKKKMEALRFTSTKFSHENQKDNLTRFSTPDQQSTLSFTDFSMETPKRDVSKEENSNDADIDPSKIPLIEELSKRGLTPLAAKRKVQATIKKQVEDELSKTELKPDYLSTRPF